MTQKQSILTQQTASPYNDSKELIERTDSPTAIILAITILVTSLITSVTKLVQVLVRVMLQRSTSENRSSRGNMKK